MRLKDKLRLLFLSLFLLFLSFSLNSPWFKSLLLISIPALLYLFIYRLESKIRELRYLLSRLRMGDYSIRVFVDSDDEIGSAFKELNELAQYVGFLAEKGLECEGRFGALLELLGDPVALFDELGRLVEANSQFIFLFMEKDKEKAKGRWYWQFIKSRDFLEFFESIREKKRVHDFKISLDNRTFLGRGLLSKKGVLIYLKEVTEEVRLRERESGLISSIAHEIKTPLSVIKGAVETLQSEIGDNRMVNLLARNVERLVKVASEILTLRELEERKVFKETVNLVELCSDVLSSLEGEAKRKGVRIYMEASHGEVKAQGDRALLESAILNLVENAIKYNRGGGSVKVGIRDLGESLEVAVEDTGLGISKEHLPYIFERFYVVDKSRSKKLGGVGLGLSIVKEVVLLHDGRIEVESELGKGSKFRLILPK